MYLQANPALAAEQSLRVSPVIINVTLSPGKTYTHAITIENLTDTPMPLRASLNDFLTSGEEGGYIFEETRSNPLLSWVKLNQTELILEPKAKKEIQMTITTPASIPLGGYYGVLFFEPVQSGLPNATRVNSKIGILMLANIGVPDPNATKAEIISFSTGILKDTNTLPLTLRVKNVSLNFFTAKPILTLSPLFPSSPSHSLTLEDKILFPGQIRRWETQPNIPDLPPNIYRAYMAVSTGNGQYVTTDRYFVIFPFAKTISGAVIILLILFLVVKRKRLGKAVRAFYK